MKRLTKSIHECVAGPAVMKHGPVHQWCLDMESQTGQPKDARFTLVNHKDPSDRREMVLDYADLQALCAFLVEAVVVLDG